MPYGKGYPMKGKKTGLKKNAGAKIVKVKAMAKAKKSVPYRKPKKK